MSEQNWNTRTVYKVMGDDEPREAFLVTFVPEDKALLNDPKELAVGAGIVLEFLRAELSPQMLEVVLTLLYSKGQQFFDKTMDMAQETLKLQREVIKTLQPPQGVIDLVNREINWLEEREEARELIDWMDAVTTGGFVYDTEDGGEGESGEERVEAGSGPP